MNKNEFLKQLKKKLLDFPKSEQDKVLAYYNEMFEDQLEEGKSEEEISAGFGTIDEIVARMDKNQKRVEPQLSKWTKWIIAFPILLILYLCALILDLCLWTVAGSFLATAIFIAIAWIPYLISALSHLISDPLITLYQTGGCFLVLGIGCFLTLGSYYCAELGRKFFHLLKDSWIRAKEGF